MGELKSYKVMEIIEYKIGDTFYLEDGTKLQVVKANCNCKGCHFFNDKDNRCSRTKDIICSAPRRKDKEFVIFKQIKNNNIIKKKMTIDIYVVMQTHKTHRSFCDVFTSFKEANARFEELLKYFKELTKVQPKGWTSKDIPSQIKVSIIGDIALYLSKETKEVEIEIEDTSTNTDNSTANVRHFYNKEECIDEMSKFSPFGVLYNKSHKRYVTVLEITDEDITIMSANHEIATISFFSAKNYFTFLDNSPFGIY